MNECSSTFWTDSTAVLQSIRNSKKRFCTFVANRLVKIDRNTDVSQWRHVSTKMNPAEDASRGLRVDAYLKSGRWINEFLHLPEDKWPKMPDCFPDPPSEFCPKPVQSQKQKKATCWLRRFKKYLRSEKPQDKLTELPSRLTVQELNYAERDIIKYVQRQSFHGEMKCLLNDKVINKGDCSRRMLKLNPTLEDGLMKVGGRLENAPIMHSSKHPIILSHISHPTDLVIREHHNKVGHSGMGHTWTSLREKYWVWNDSHVHGYLRQKGITWHKSPPTGSNHGGAWERMIRSIRRIFTAVTQRQTMTDEVFRTALIECESCLNSRPLIPVTFNPRDEEPLTPNHL
ncbi:uncharacterized protein LOC144427253 [Styela clava]